MTVRVCLQQGGKNDDALLPDHAHCRIKWNNFSPECDFLYVDERIVIIVLTPSLCIFPAETMRGSAQRWKEIR